MVHALRRARDLVRPGGVVVDLHPTAERAVVLVGDVAAGVVDTADAPQRHQAASDAIITAVGDELFTVDLGVEFDFSVYADTLDELQEHIVDDWRDARIGDAAMARARELLQRAANAQVRVRERVCLTLLRPMGRDRQVAE